ncbi:MAG: TetR/AcrR family transcriptional regulator, partial [Bacteroidota bacterium]
RKEREKARLREQIIEAATTLFLQHGYQETSIRMIAHEIEYSPTTIYSHFQDKDMLFQEIMMRAFGLFFSFLAPEQAIEDPMERLQAMNRAYMRFAFAHPAYYDLMFVIREPMKVPSQEGSFEMGKKSHDFLTETVAACIKAGYFKGQDAEALALTIWASVHGLIALKGRLRLEMYTKEKQEALMEAGLKALHQLMER